MHSDVLRTCVQWLQWCGCSTAAASAAAALEATMLSQNEYQQLDFKPLVTSCQRCLSWQGPLGCAWVPSP